MADVAADEEVIEREERRLIHSIFEFGDTVVREVMLPRPDMVVVDADETIEAAIATAIEVGFSRLPAYEGATDNIVGLVYLKDLVARARAGDGERPVRAVAARRGVRARAEARRRAAARDADPEVPHGDRDRRARRHRRARHARGPARGDRRRDRRRVRRRDARARAPARRRAPRAGPHADRRGERGARRRAARHRVGHRRRPGLQPARPRARGGRDRSVPGPRVPHRAGRGPPHRVGADPRARRPAPSPARDAEVTRRVARRDASAPGSSRSSGAPTSGSRRS